MDGSAPASGRGCKRFCGLTDPQHTKSKYGFFFKGSSPDGIFQYGAFHFRVVQHGVFEHGFRKIPVSQSGFPQFGAVMKDTVWGTAFKEKTVF